MSRIHAIASRRPAWHVPMDIRQVLRAVLLATMLGLASICGGSDRGFAQGRGGAPADIDRIMETLRELPLFRLMLSEVPEADSMMREALAAEMRSPTRSGPPRTFVVVRQLMRDHMVPGLQKAEDGTILAAIRDQEKIAVHLQSTNVPICREFGLSGIQNASRLDPEGKTLLRQATDSLAAAYRSGKQRSGITVSPPSDQEARDLLEEAGFDPREFERLSQFATLSESDACALTVRVYNAPSRLVADKGARLGRIILLWSYN